MSDAPRIADICEKLNLSKATVSKALNGYDSVRKETRDRVLACAREMGYMPPAQNRDLNTRLLRIGITATITVGNPDGISPFQTMLPALMEELGQYHYDTIILPPSLLREQNIPYDQAMRNLNLDCALLTGLRFTDPYYQQLQTTEFPTVMWDMSIDNPHVRNVSCDSIEGMRLATQHLISLGHREIGFINGHLNATVSLQRRDGYILALAEAGIPYQPELVFEGDFSESAGVIGYHQLIQKKVTGIVCVSDVTALGVFRAAYADGLRIPEDLSIVGYDNTNLTAYTTPEMTSVEQHADQIGRVIATTIHSMLHHRFVGDSIVHPSLAVRGSTAAPRE